MNSRLITLALGTFAIGIDAFVTAGLVTPVSNDLTVSTSAAGQLVTVFALSYAVLSPILATATARLSRKRVLLIALSLFVLGNVVTALAGTFALVLASRVIAAAGASMYTPNATAVAAALSPPERRGRAISVVIGGLTVATALGVPIGTWIGGAFSWRATLWLVAALGALALASVAAVVPTVQLPAPARLRERLLPLRDKTIATGLLHAVLLFGGMFTVYTYLSAAMHPATGGSTGRFTILLWIYGLTAVVGSTVGGRLVDRLGSRRIMPLTLIGAGVVVALIQVSGQHFATATVVHRLRHPRLDLGCGTTTSAGLTFPARFAATARPQCLGPVLRHRVGRRGGRARHPMVGRRLTRLDRPGPGGRIADTAHDQLARIQAAECCRSCGSTDG